MFTYRVNEDIHLRLLEIRDADQLFTLTDKSRDHLRKWLPWVDFTTTVEDSRAFIQSGLNQYAANNGFELGIWFREQLSGVIGLHAVSWSNRLTSIGYWLGEEFQGNGIMTSACGAVVDGLFKEYGLNRVEIRAATENLRSRAIPERLGFHTEGCIRQAEHLNGHYVDHVIYSMLAQEWAD